MTDEAPTSSNFIRDLVAEHLAAGRYDRVVTRFPPEPNGYLHIGHAKSICLNFGLAQRFGGVCHLRMDDTNPTKEETEYVDSIAADVRWLGFEWKGQPDPEHPGVPGKKVPFYASDYFQQLYDWAELLVRKGLAYVDSVSREELRRNRGSLNEPGRESPFRQRSVEENLDLLRRMKAGEFDEGEHVLRAKIDLASPNMMMRDPLMYRILKAHHHRTGDAWCIYPMYDYAHGLSDALEGITHSICTLEFENNRELYDWFVEAVGFTEPRPHQYEFARLALDYTVMSKRKLLLLVKDGHVDGWDDPRMPTIAGLRRRGVRPEAIRAFAEMIGVARTNSTVDIGKLEFCIREDLNLVSPRVMVVLNPLEVVIETMPEHHVEWLEAPYWPQDIPKEGARKLPLTRTIYVERDDFMEHPPKDFHRLVPGGEVRLRYGYVIKCERVEHDADGKVSRLVCSHDPTTRHGEAGATKKVKGTVHWVSAAHAVDAEVRLYDRLFRVPAPDREDGDFLTYLNPKSKLVVTAKCEPGLAALGPGAHVQFERQGYFFSDPVDHAPGRLAFNKVVGLRDSWAAMVQRKEETDASKAEEDLIGFLETATRRRDSRPEKLTRTEIRERVFANDPSLRMRCEGFMGLGLNREDSELIAETHALADFFDAARAAWPDAVSPSAAVATADGVAAKAIAKWIVNELLRTLKDRELAALPLTPAALAGLAALVEAGTISATAGKQVFAELVDRGGEPGAIVARDGLAQVSDEAAIAAATDAVLAANGEQVAKYRGGKPQLLGFFVGQVMKAMGGRANPERVASVVKNKLG